MTDEQRQRIWEIENSCDGRTELAERIVALEDEAKRLQTCVLTLDSELADWKGQYDPTDIYVRKAQDENAKLRELADAVKEFVEDTHCEDCPCRRDCDDNNRIFCVNDFSYHAFAAMRELSMEVES